jgi:hypothetical protein
MPWETIQKVEDATIIQQTYLPYDYYGVSEAYDPRTPKNPT